MTSNNCDPVEQQLRQERLDALYEADGRHDPKHPMHALYTGLLIDKKEEADAALAQPEPQGPTDEELKATYWEAFKNAAPCGADESWLAGLRAVACWNRPVIAPDGPAVPDGREPASVADQPTDKELLELMPETMRNEFAAVSDVCSTVTGGQVAPGIFRTVLNTGALEYARAVLARWGRLAIEPVPVSERLPEPGIKVLAHYFNSHGKSRTVCARWIPAKFESGDSDVYDDDFLEYDEESDTFYWPEAWYEEIENWDDYGSVKINEGEVTHWQPLPHWALPVPQQEVE